DALFSEDGTTVPSIVMAASMVGTHASTWVEPGVSRAAFNSATLRKTPDNSALSLRDGIVDDSCGRSFRIHLVGRRRVCARDGFQVCLALRRLGCERAQTPH